MQGNEAFMEFQEGVKVAFSFDNRIISGQRQLIRIASLENSDSRKLRDDVKSFPQFKLSSDGRMLATIDDRGLSVCDVLTNV